MRYPFWGLWALFCTLCGGCDVHLDVESPEINFGDPAAEACAYVERFCSDSGVDPCQRAREECEEANSAPLANCAQQAEAAREGCERANEQFDLDSQADCQEVHAEVISTCEEQNNQGGDGGSTRFTPINDPAAPPPGQED